MTIKKVLVQSISKLIEAKIPTPELDARVLIKHVLQFDDIDLIKNMNQLASTRAIGRIEKMVARRAEHEPVAYILGQKEFYSLNFLVNKNVLIPRPESEWLVEKAINLIKNSNRKIKNILDLGTGSGCLIISVLRSLKIQNSKFEIHASASDISPDALKVATQNAKNNGTLNIKFICSDLFASIEPQIKFDLIIANLPYVPTSGTDISTSFEPKIAIFAPDNGTKIIKKFLSQAQDHLSPNGYILIELDPRNAKDLENFAQKHFSKSKILLEKDLAGFDRYLTINA